MTHTHNISKQLEELAISKKKKKIVKRDTNHEHRQHKTEKNNLRVQPRRKAFVLVLWREQSYNMTTTFPTHAHTKHTSP